MLWDDDMGWEIEEDLDWEDREALEEYRYWLDWADGVLNQDPEPGEASEAEAEVDLLPGPELPEEVLEALAEAPLAYWWSLTEALQELEQEAGMFLEGRVRVKLHLLRLLLGLPPPRGGRTPLEASGAGGRCLRTQAGAAHQGRPEAGGGGVA